MSAQPCIETHRLYLRPFVMEDAPRVMHLAGSWDVADTTQAIPHPYVLEDAKRWLHPQARDHEEGYLSIWAVVLKSQKVIIGAISLEPNPMCHWVELGYWFGKDYWNQGFCTEASRALLKHAFNTLNMNRVQACHLTRNVASGKVMQKIGMCYEGTRREAILKWNIFEDVDCYSILKREYTAFHQDT
jgi:RimJ/RimL family protein N-acetyltransferase